MNEKCSILATVPQPEKHARIAQINTILHSQLEIPNSFTLCLCGSAPFDFFLAQNPPLQFNIPALRNYLEKKEKKSILLSTFHPRQTPLLVEGQNICDVAIWTGFRAVVVVPDWHNGYNIKEQP